MKRRIIIGARGDRWIGIGGERKKAVETRRKAVINKGVLTGVAGKAS